MKIKSIIIGLLVLCCHNIMAQDLKMGFHVGGNLSGYTGGKQYTITTSRVKLDMKLVLTSNTY